MKEIEKFGKKERGKSRKKKKEEECFGQGRGKYGSKRRDKTVRLSIFCYSDPVC